MSKKKKKKNSEEGLETILGGETIHKPYRTSLTLVLIISLLGGLAGGFASDYITDNYIEKPVTSEITEPTAETQEKIPEKPVAKEQTDQEYIPIEEVEYNVDSVSNSVVNIYIQKTKVSENILDKTYRVEDSLGKGFILTSDGWIVTQSAIFDESKINDDTTFVVVTADKKLYPFTDYIVDPLTHTAFFKIDVLNLPVAKLGSQEKINITEPIILYNLDNIVVTYLKNISYTEIQKAADLVHSSEEYYKYLLLRDKIDKDFIGSPIINQRGEIIGIINSIDESGKTTALPINYLDPVIKNIFKYNQPKRSYLGVNYVDLSTLITEKDGDAATMLDKGAMLYSNKDLKINGVEPESPASGAGLQPNDIILKVEDDEVNSKQSLTKLIQEYPVGSTLNLLILRENLEIEIKVTLEELPM